MNTIPTLQNMFKPPTVPEHNVVTPETHSPWAELHDTMQLHMYVKVNKHLTPAPLTPMSVSSTLLPTANLALIGTVFVVAGDAQMHKVNSAATNISIAIHVTQKMHPVCVHQ